MIRVVESRVVNSVSQKIIDPENLIKLQNDVVQCLVGFNIMTHLLVHLVKEIDILGPVFLHNMFPFERFMGVLKKCVRNRARPEGSIASAYGTEEVIEFCVDFIDDLKPIGVPESRYEGRLTGNGILGKKSQSRKRIIRFFNNHPWLTHISRNTRKFCYPISRKSLRHGLHVST